MADTPTLPVPIEVLKTAANISQAQMKSTFNLAALSSAFAVLGPMLAAFEPSLAHWIVACCAFIVAGGGAFLARLHGLNLAKSAEDLTNAIIQGTVGIATEIGTDLGGNFPAIPTAPIVSTPAPPA